MSSHRFPLLLVGAFLALYLIWGSTYFVIRIGVQSWPPMLLAGLRFVIAGSLMFVWLRWRGVALPTMREWRSCAVVGFLLLSCGNGGVTIAEHLGVASAVAALAIATVPLFALVFGLIWGQRTTGLEWGGILLGLTGIGLLNLGHNLQASPLGIRVTLVDDRPPLFVSGFPRFASLSSTRDTVRVEVQVDDGVAQRACKAWYICVLDNDNVGSDTTTTTATSATSAAASTAAAAGQFSLGGGPAEHCASARDCGGGPG